MMTGHRKSGKRLSHLPAFHCPCCGMIYRDGHPPQTLLKSLRVFPYIVGQSGQFRLFLSTKGTGKCFSLCSCSLQMGKDCLFFLVV